MVLDIEGKRYALVGGTSKGLGLVPVLTKEVVEVIKLEINEKHDVRINNIICIKSGINSPVELSDLTSPIQMAGKMVSYTGSQQIKLAHISNSDVDNLGENIISVQNPGENKTIKHPFRDWVQLYNESPTANSLLKFYEQFFKQANENTKDKRAVTFTKLVGFHSGINIPKGLSANGGCQFVILDNGVCIVGGHSIGKGPIKASLEYITAYIKDNYSNVTKVVWAS